jgi:hypothetical protein
MNFRKWWQSQNILSNLGHTYSYLDLREAAKKAWDAAKTEAAKIAWEHARDIRKNKPLSGTRFDQCADAINEL